MSLPALVQYSVFLIIVIALVRPFGRYMARVFEGQKTWPDFVLRPFERLIYKLTRVDATVEMNWKQYAISFVMFSLVGTIALYLLLRLQHLLPFGLTSAYLTTPLTPDLAMNTAVSFSTTTTWQAYAGETTMTYFSQVAGLVVQNFLAGAGGLSVGVAFIRGFARDETNKLGNFWVDLVRALLWVLLPLSILASLILVWQGVPMNFNPYVHATTIEGGSQTIAQGPVAALGAIKNLGTNGGGFFNVNAAHPFENPTPFSNLFELLLIAVLPAAFVNTFGRMTGRLRESRTLLAAMVFLFVTGSLACGWAEQRGNPLISRELNRPNSSQLSAVANMEGKEVRFGAGGSVLAAVTTSNGATGSYSSMHDSYTPIGGGVPLINMLLGEIVFGGLGTGLYSIILIALIGLFLAGLMIGRSPEYLGKKIGITEIKFIMLYALASPLAVLILTAIAVATHSGLAGLTTNSSVHGLTEIVYAYASSVANNGQNFAGLNANSVFYNVTTGIAMMIGRFGLAIPALALAGSFAAQRRRPTTLGTLPAYTFTFGVLVVVTALIVGGLSYFPVLALGPVIEHLLMMR